MTHLQVDPPSYLKTPPLGGTLPGYPVDPVTSNDLHARTDGYDERLRR